MQKQVAYIIFPIHAILNISANNFLLLIYEKLQNKIKILGKSTETCGGVIGNGNN